MLLLIYISLLNINKHCIGIHNCIKQSNYRKSKICTYFISECNDGDFGYFCENRCFCDGDPCDKVTGICPSGKCLPGYSGEKCDAGNLLSLINNLNYPRLAID